MLLFIQVDVSSWELQCSRAEILSILYLDEIKYLISIFFYIINILWNNLNGWLFTVNKRNMFRHTVGTERKSLIVLTFFYINFTSYLWMTSKKFVWLLLCEYFCKNMYLNLILTTDKCTYINTINTI